MGQGGIIFSFSYHPKISLDHFAGKIAISYSNCLQTKMGFAVISQSPPVTENMVGAK